MAVRSKVDPPPINPALLEATGEFALLATALCRGDFAEADRAAGALARLGYHVALAPPREGPGRRPGREDVR